MRRPGMESTHYDALTRIAQKFQLIVHIAKPGVASGATLFDLGDDCIIGVEQLANNVNHGSGVEQYSTHMYIFTHRSPTVDKSVRSVPQAHTLRHCGVSDAGGHEECNEEEGTHR